MKRSLKRVVDAAGERLRVYRRIGFETPTQYRMLIRTG
jgi:hypothetical protein